MEDLASIEQLIHEDIQRCIEEGVNHYKSLMEDLLKTLQPLKDSQLKEYHDKSLQVIIQAFEDSFVDIVAQLEGVDSQHQIKEQLTTAKARVETLVTIQFNEIYLRMHEIQINAVVKKVKEFTNDAETLYDERAQEFFIPPGIKTRNDLKVNHEKWKTEAVHRLNKLLEENEMKKEEFWTYELADKLEERLDDLCEDENTVADDSSDSIVADCNVGDQYLSAHPELHTESSGEETTEIMFKKPAVAPGVAKRVDTSLLTTTTTATALNSMPPKTTTSTSKSITSKLTTAVTSSLKLVTTRFKTATGGMKAKIGDSTSSSASPGTFQKPPEPIAPIPPANLLNTSIAPIHAPTTSRISQPHPEDENVSPNFQTGIEAISPELSSRQKIDIGVHFDERLFKVGTNSFTTTHPRGSCDSFTALASVSPEIYFSENGILIGQQAHEYRSKTDNRYFNVFRLLLLNSPISVHNFIIENNSYELCDLEIIAAFLRSVINIVELKNNAKVRKIVFTIPFTPTNLVKEKIQEFAKTAGFTDIRVLSTVLTSGVVALDAFNFYSSTQKPLLQKSKSILVVDYQEQSFSMGIVEMNSTTISVKHPYGSDNMVECQKGNFGMWHKSLYLNDGLAVPQEWKDEIFNIYKSAIGQVYTSKRIFAVDSVAVSEHKSGTIESILFEILKGKITLLDSTLGPLCGASMLASLFSAELDSSDLTPDIPLSINALDSWRSNLRMIAGLKQEYTQIWNVMGKPIRNHPEFYQDVVITVANKNAEVSFFINLDELYGTNLTISNACQYRLTCKSKTYDSTDQTIVSLVRINVMVRIRCWLDADRLYELRAEILKANSPVEIDLIRTDTLTSSFRCKHSDSSGYGKLIKLYERTANLS